MEGIYIVSEDSVAEIVANSYYGADFKCDILNQDDGTFKNQNLDMTEIQEPISDVSTEVVGNHDSGLTEINIDDSSSLSIGYRVKIQNYIYRIVRINGNTITIHTELYENLADGSSVDRVGNLGIFKLIFNIDEVGIYTLIGKDSVFGLNSTKMIKVVPKSLADMYKDIKNLEYAILGS